MHVLSIQSRCYFGTSMIELDMGDTDEEVQEASPPEPKKRLSWLATSNDKLSHAPRYVELDISESYDGSLADMDKDVDAC